MTCRKGWALVIVSVFLFSGFYASFNETTLFSQFSNKFTTYLSPCVNFIKFYKEAKKYEWKIDLNNKENVILLTKGAVTLHFMIVYRRPKYWFLPSSGPNGAAYLPFSLNAIFIDSAHILVPQNMDWFRRQHARSRFIECNRTIATQLKTDYPHLFQTNSHVIAPDQFNGLAAFRDLLYAVNTTPILFGGTALGWYRECDLLSHTTDLDMALPPGQYSPKIEKVILEHDKLSLYWVLGKPTDSLELSAYYEGVKLDLFLMYNAPRHRTWVGGMIVWQRQKLRWMYPAIEGLCSADLRGDLFTVPCNVEAFIEADYGTNWSVPFETKDFVWYHTHNNIEKMGVWRREEWDEVYRTQFPR